MPKPIDLHTLERELRKADDFSKLARRYFREVSGTPGKLSFELIDPDAIIPPPAARHRRATQYAFADIPGGIAGWLIRLEVDNRLDRYERRKQSHPDAIRVVAEGDSWFQHPLLNDLIDGINGDPAFNVLSLASGGSELCQMTCPKDYLTAVRTERPKLFLLSAGGNDFLEDIRRFVRPDRPPFPDAPDGYIKTAPFNRLLGQIRGWLRQIFADVLARGSSVERVLMHNYDYAIPVPPAKPSTPGPILDTRSGPWLGARFDELGFRDPGTRQAVAAVLLDRYREVCSEVAAEPRWGGRVEVFAFKRKLTRTHDWYDEIHPDNASAKKLAAEYLVRMKGPTNH